MIYFITNFFETLSRIVQKGLIVAIALFFLHGCASIPAPEGELLMAQAPEGWLRIYVLNNERTRITELVPAGETAQTWRTKFSLESYLGEMDANPETLLLQQAYQDETQCSFVQKRLISSNKENGYATAVHLVLCGEVIGTGRGQVKLLKAIQGNEHFYVIQLIRNLPVFEPGQAQFEKPEMAAWSQILSRIFVCDSRLPEHSCDPS